LSNPGIFRFCEIPAFIGNIKKLFVYAWNNPGILNPRIIPEFKEILGIFKDVKKILGISLDIEL
jgi:hypothetical protein